jgi:hypothetical protein
MTIHNTLQLRYLGVLPQSQCLEYGFQIDEKDKVSRLFVLMIETGFFKEFNLMFQEAPDLCYQKLLVDLQHETADVPVRDRYAVTASDIALYRESHPNTKTRKAARADKRLSDSPM